MRSPKLSIFEAFVLRTLFFSPENYLRTSYAFSTNKAYEVRRAYEEIVRSVRKKRTKYEAYESVRSKADENVRRKRTKYEAYEESVRRKRTEAK